jgi:hypothetical protein
MGVRICSAETKKRIYLINAADATYAEHPNGKSHSIGVVGFESDMSCYFGFVSSK